jgi:hypothetical protein
MFIGKIICLFLAILFTLSNVTRAYHKNAIPAINFILQAVGIAGFIVLQWMID